METMDKKLEWEKPVLEDLAKIRYTLGNCTPGSTGSNSCTPGTTVGPTTYCDTFGGSTVICVTTGNSATVKI